jgi:hypothetical protein
MAGLIPAFFVTKTEWTPSPEKKGWRPFRKKGFTPR